MKADRLLGTVELMFPEADLASVLNLLIKSEMECLRVWQENGFGHMEVHFGEAARIRSLLEKNGIRVEKTRKHGILPRITPYLRRVGLYIGFFLFAVVLFVSGRLVWRVEVLGNTRLDTVDVLHILRENGFGVGSSVATKTGILADRCVASAKEIAWMSVVVQGTTAYVHILEAEDPTLPRRVDYVNLVAAKDAVIEKVVANRGRVAVQPGSVVRAGDLLVSGVVPTAHGSVFVGASGEVWGRISEEISLEVSALVPQKVYDSPICEKITVNFLGFSTNIFKYTGNSPSVYDTIREEETLRLFGKALPFSYTVVRMLPYHTETRMLSEEEVVRYASVLLEEKVRAALQGSEVLEKETEFQTEGGRCVATCRVTYVADIARSIPFSLE